MSGELTGGASRRPEPHCEDDIYYGPCGCPDLAFCCFERDQYGECGHTRPLRASSGPGSSS